MSIIELRTEELAASCKQMQDRIKQLETERQEMIDALMLVNESEKMSSGLTLISDRTKSKIKQALRNAGEITEE